MTTVTAPPADSEALLRKCSALQSGHFLLSSGLHSGEYVQVARISDHPRDLELVARQMAPALRALEATLVVSPALGAVLFGHELARALDIRHAFAERPGGEFELRRGFEVRQGERVLLAENVITTGGSVLEVAELVASLGGIVAGFATVIDRSQGRFSPSQPVFAYSAVQARAFEPADCPLCQQGLPLVKPGSRLTPTTDT